jgi:hypothetical protein
MREAKYLYGIIAAADQGAVHSEIRGIEDGEVSTIQSGDIAAVVSNIEDRRIRPERRHLAAHHGVLKLLMERTTPLPVTFGVIANSSAAVKRILNGKSRDLSTHLERVRGKIEMGLKVTLDVPNIFEYFVMTHPELRDLRDLYFGTHREPTQEQKIELGRVFDRLLNEDREAFTAQVSGVLSKYCSEIKVSKCAKVNDVMNLACLVERGKVADFEQGVFEAAKLFDNNFAFDFNGPWAPHNFVNVELKI